MDIVEGGPEETSDTVGDGVRNLRLLRPRATSRAETYPVEGPRKGWETLYYEIQYPTVCKRHLPVLHL